MPTTNMLTSKYLTSCNVWKTFQDWSFLHPTTKAILMLHLSGDSMPLCLFSLQMPRSDYRYGRLPSHQKLPSRRMLTWVGFVHCEHYSLRITSGHFQKQQHHFKTWYPGGDSERIRKRREGVHRVTLRSGCRLRRRNTPARMTGRTGIARITRIYAN